jgi:probable HAF family extracellular repeat protein
LLNDFLYPLRLCPFQPHEEGIIRTKSQNQSTNGSTKKDRKMKTANLKILAVLGIIALLAPYHPVRAESQMIDLGTLGGSYSVAADINNRNQVVGSSYYAEEGSEMHAFLWSDGVMTDLGTLGGPESFAAAINEAGVIVGQASLEANDFRAFLWRNGRMYDLGTLGGWESAATDINNHGQVVGESVTESGERHAFLWQRGVMIDLGTLGGDFSSAKSINDRGEIVGYSTTEQGESHPFIWRRGRMTDLGTLGGSFGSAESINSRGQAVGGAADEEGIGHGTMWYMGKIIELEILPAFENCSPEHINNLGQITGYYQISPEYYGAFLYKDGVTIDLGSLGGGFSEGSSVNENGYVVGVSSNGSQLHAFLWTP